MEKILKFLQMNGMLNQSELQVSQQILYDQRTGKDVHYSSVDQHLIKCSYSLSQELFQKACTEIKALQKDIQVFQSRFKGQKMPAYHQLYPLDSEGTLTLQHQQNQVLLVNIWGTWRESCRNLMQQNQQMLTKNEDKWKNQVRIVAISFDQSKDQIIECVNSKGWNKIQHLTLLSLSRRHPLIQDFLITDIPAVILVNKSGIIDFAGHPNETNLEKRINRLLEGDHEDTGQIKEKESILSVDQIIREVRKSEVLNQLLSKQQLQEKFGKLDLFSLKRERKFIITKGKYQFEPYLLKVWVYEDSTEAIQQLKDHLKEIDPTIYAIEENIVKFVVPPTAENAQCVDCKVKLSYPFYWCKWDQNPNNFRCRDCVEKKPVEENKHFNYLKNSILLAAPFQKIGAENCGKNIQPENSQKITGPFYFNCSCWCFQAHKVGDATYTCLVCRSAPHYYEYGVDICENCLTKYLNGDNKLRELLEIQNGHKANHPLLRILYNFVDYGTL